MSVPNHLMATRAQRTMMTKKCHNSVANVHASMLIVHSNPPAARKGCRRGHGLRTEWPRSPRGHTLYPLGHIVNNSIALG